MKERSLNMKRLFFYAIILIWSFICGLVLCFLFDPNTTIDPAPKWSDPPTAEEYIAHGYRWADCNRRIRDQEYIGGTWYHADPNVTVYLDLIEQEGGNAPVLYYTASDPNTTIYLYQQLLMNTSGGPIRWPEADANDYAAFLDKKITLHSGGEDYDISGGAPMTVR